MKTPSTRLLLLASLASALWPTACGGGTPSSRQGRDGAPPPEMPSPTPDASGDSSPATHADAGSGAEAPTADARAVVADARAVTVDSRVVVADSRPPAPDAAPASPCGICPSGFTCDAAAGVCKSGSGVPRFSHVFIIYMENNGYSAIIGNSSAPYINALATTYGLATNYYDITHPSLPNYLTLSAGDYFGISTDCLPTACPVTATNLADSIESAGLTWKAYGEDMGTPCNLADAYPYAPKHEPYLYYTDIQGTSRCAAHNVDYGSFAGDLAAGSVSFMSITPNLCHDMHDNCYGDAVLAGDQWLHSNVPPILASSAWKNGGVLFIVWDESETGDQVVALVISPLGKPKYTSATRYDHYSLLATIEDAWGLPRLANTASATPMADFFR